jgi:hypothetical protein
MNIPVILIALLASNPGYIKLQTGAIVFQEDLDTAITTMCLDPRDLNLQEAALEKLTAAHFIERALMPTSTADRLNRADILELRIITKKLVKKACPKEFR